MVTMMKTVGQAPNIPQLPEADWEQAGAEPECSLLGGPGLGWGRVGAQGGGPRIGQLGIIPRIT